MRKLLAIIGFLFCSSPVWATNYFIDVAANGASDANNGLSTGTAWLSPNHAVNCGDVLQAAAGTTYAAVNFQRGKWGVVTCAGGNNVAWLKCITFDACKINSSSGDGIAVSASYWGVQGWEVTTSGVFAGCFSAIPVTSGIVVHHIVFANNIANGCSSGGFAIYNNSFTNASFDYVSVVGNIAYNAAIDGSFCYSNISLYQPLKIDAKPGTHLYVAGNFSWNARDPATCNGGIPTDGEGIIFDTFDGAQSGMVEPYAQQSVVDNNIVLHNGRGGIQTGGHGNVAAHIYWRQNTAYGNNSDPNATNTACGGDIMILGSPNVTQFVEAYRNIAKADVATGCNGTAKYAMFCFDGGANDHIYTNWADGVGGNDLATNACTGFSFGPNNTVSTDPAFVSTTIPGAPSCGAFASVPACMATVIANFTPTNAAAKAYGYQVPLATQIYDPLFPLWLCNVNLPAGLVTMGCVTGSAFPTGASLGTGITLQ